MIILQILKNLCSIEPTVNHSSSAIKTIDYYLFCFKLDRFLEENQSTLMKQTNYSKIRTIIQDISSKFETLNYFTKEIGTILCFFNEWTSNAKTFEDHKQVLTKYKQLGGDFSKIIRVITQFDYYSNKEYDMISVLGHGGEGVALKAFSKKINEMIAIKIKFEKEYDEVSSRERIQFIRRNDIEGKIKCYECNLIDNYMYSIMELGEETLADYIDRKRTVHQKQASISKGILIERLTIFTKVLQAVKSIHDHNISHRDLDPKNVVKMKEYYKIIDFDIAKVIKTGNSITLTVGKFAYMSPEVSHDNYEEMLLDGEKLAHNIGNITTSCDVFSLGCMLLKLLTDCSLRLDREFLEDSNFQKYGGEYQYFKDNGSYFYLVLTDLLREKKLHHAIQKEIDQHVDPELGVNVVLVKCLITMIQKDASKRLNCFTHMTILSKVIGFLKGDSIPIHQILKEMDNYKDISELKDIPQIIEENEQLKHEIVELKKRVKELEEKLKIK
ncbi:predicted protein [Naegleria gruberi]|uniref:Predicted protein n=1 Tax=Naegleria gruberi TaxID=5762 RepID=D2VZP2_NAEGR|nr:uncharacterized protein NAEGRDRAFT_74558 [Naegleria gruberi]EFC37732.1 predicted protein [Naegleria gruberi]|eukprot:XP_002670476.1 predicted protein [Naegleria gruberi strain NEG-M]